MTGFHEVIGWDPVMGLVSLSVEEDTRANPDFSTWGQETRQAQQDSKTWPQQHLKV